MDCQLSDCGQKTTLEQNHGTNAVLPNNKNNSCAPPQSCAESEDSQGENSAEKNGNNTVICGVDDWSVCFVFGDTNVSNVDIDSANMLVALM